MILTPNQEPAAPGATVPAPSPPRPGLIAWESRPGWGTFRTGLLLIVLALPLGFLVIAGSFMMVASVFSATSSAGPDNMPSPESAARMATVMATLMLVLSACWPLGGLWILTGLVFTPSVPSESRASGWGALSFLGLLSTLGIYATLAADTMCRGAQLLGAGLSFGIAMKTKADRPGPRRPGPGRGDQGRLSRRAAGPKDGPVPPLRHGGLHRPYQGGLHPHALAGGSLLRREGPGPQPAHPPGAVRPRLRLRGPRFAGPSSLPEG